MAAGHVDTTIKVNVLNNTVFDAVLDATVIAAWRNELYAKINDNYDDAFSKATANASPLILDSGATVSPQIRLSSTGRSVGIDQQAGTIRFIDRTGSATRFALDLLTGYITALGTVSVTVAAGLNSPEGAVTAPIGSLFLRTNGGVGTTLYTKTSGTGNTGWTVIT